MGKVPKRPQGYTWLTSQGGGQKWEWHVFYQWDRVHYPIISPWGLEGTCLLVTSVFSWANRGREGIRPQVNPGSEMDLRLAVPSKSCYLPSLPPTHTHLFFSRIQEILSLDKVILAPNIWSSSPSPPLPSAFEMFLRVYFKYLLLWKDCSKLSFHFVHVFL